MHCEQVYNVSCRVNIAEVPGLQPPSAIHCAVLSENVDQLYSILGQLKVPVRAEKRHI
jgi:hypothetical protein